MPTPRYSIVVPVFRSARSLPELHARLHGALAELDGGFELILVDDGSGDESWTAMQALRRADRRVRIVRLARNHGQHAALLCGFTYARGAFVLTMDDDLQNPPEEVPRLIATITAGPYDLVYGIPREQDRHPLRRAGSILYSRLLSLLFGHGVGTKISSFRIIRREIVDRMLRLPIRHPAVGPLALRVTRRIGTVSVNHPDRPHGHGHYTAAKLLRLFLDGTLVHGLLRPGTPSTAAPTGGPRFEIAEQETAPGEEREQASPALATEDSGAPGSAAVSVPEGSAAPQSAASPAAAERGEVSACSASPSSAPGN